MSAARKWLLIACLAAPSAACSVPNRDHCGNLKGAATCIERGLGDYCSLCVAANDGCVDQAPAGDCLYTSSDPQTTSDPTTATTPTDTTTTTTTSTTTGTSTGNASTTTTIATSATGDTTATTEAPPMCGNNIQEGNEACDGTDLDDQSCNKVNDNWGGGTLLCARDCTAFDQSQCCLNIGVMCNPMRPTPNETCCNGSTCELPLLTCQ